MNRQLRQKQAECKSLQKLQQNVDLAQPLSDLAGDTVTVFVTVLRGNQS